MIIPWLIRISLFLQLSYLCFIEGITITNQDAITSDRLSIDNPFSRGSFVVRSPSIILQAPKDDHYDVRGNNVEKYDVGVAGVIPLDWKERQPGRKYLPPRGLVGTYGPPSVSPIEGDSPLYTPSYSTQSWNTHSYVRAQLHRDRNAEENNGECDDKEETTRHEDATTKDIKPVYELLNDETSYEPRNDERDYEVKLPEGNRAKEQSTSPNTVTSLGHRLPTVTHGFPSDTNGDAVQAATSLSTLDWFLTDKSYNTPLHPPPNPIISLILSHYGRYLPGTNQPKIYSYMAVNNVHNNRPFGQYKLSRDEGPDSQFR